MSCLPGWKTQGLPCPYGKLGPLEVTQPTGGNKIWVIGGYVFILSLGIIGLMLSQLVEKKIALSSIAGACLIAQFIIVTVIKKSANQLRPVGSCALHCGFPSGHSSIVMCMLGLGITLLPYMENKVVGEALVGMLAFFALWTMVSRIVVKDHSFVQVVVGGLIGSAVASAAYGATKIIPGLKKN